MSARSMKAVARDVIRRNLSERYEPTSRELMDEYGLTERQLRRVKQVAKEYAADSGYFWGVDPATYRYCAAPSADTVTTRRMIGYAAKQWADAGRSVRHQTRGLHAQGNLTDEAYRALDKRYVRLIGDLSKVERSVVEAVI